tara:strand:+ start:1217 stop:2776 length:1560 start_codon:yes stop_codon:yes gene_type:complete
MAITYHAGRRVQGTSTGAGWSIDGASYDSVSFSVASQDTAPTCIRFKDDGTKMYMLGSNDTVYQYTLSTSWDISTASYDSVSFSTGSQDTNSFKIDFKSDGTKMYMLGINNNIVYQYTLSSAWVISTASYDSVSFSVGSQDTAPRGMTFKPDGTKMYIAGVSNDTIYQYTLSSAWDMSTASYDSVSFSVASQDANPVGIVFKDDGTKISMIGITTATVYQYTLSTAWDVSTASYDSVSFSITGQDSSPRGMTFKSDGTKMYMVGVTSDTVYQYTTSSSDSTLLTNAQVGSRFEETDTRKMYHYNAPTLSFEDDFDTDSGWTTAGASVIDTTNEYWRQIDRTPMYKSLGVSLDTTWVCDLDIYWTGIGVASWQGYIMFTNYGATAYNSSTGTPQYIGLRQRTDGKETLRITNYAGGETNATDVFMATGASVNTWYFYRVIRNGNDATLTRYTSDANRTSDTGGVSITSTGFVAQVSWDESVKIQYIDGTGYSSDQEYRIKNVKIYNGVTSTDTAWTEEGT